jgi:hypothetical protein
MQVDTKKKWEQGMKEEMDSLENNQTWDLVQLPAGKRALQNKWVYKLKEENGGEKRYKARLVVKGFAQKKGIYFDEIISPVVKMTSIRTILSLVAVEDLHLEQLDVKIAFLHGDLEEENYMQQPQGYEVKRKENLVCRLKKSLYGLKQAPRQWYLNFGRFMTEQGYSRCHSDQGYSRLCVLCVLFMHLFYFIAPRSYFSNTDYCTHGKIVKEGHCNVPPPSTPWSGQHYYVEKHYCNIFCILMKHNCLITVKHSVSTLILLAYIIHEINNNS